MEDRITAARLEKYFAVTSRALQKVKIPLRLPSPDLHAVAKDFLDMAQRYYADAEHFQENGDIVTAFAALNYAHGWLDAGARMGIFDVGGDSALFTVDSDNRG